MAGSRFDVPGRQSECRRPSDTTGVLPSTSCSRELDAPAP